MKIIILFLASLIHLSAQNEVYEKFKVITNSNCLAGYKLMSYCSTSGEISIEENTPVYIVDVNRCDKELFYNVVVDSSYYWIHSSFVHASYNYEDIFNQIDKKTLSDIKILLKQHSKVQMAKEKAEAFKFLLDCQKKGVLITDYSIFDESEYTDGTGFEIEIMNLSKKTIKYIWFNLSGKNAVGDLVTDPIKRISTLQFKGIGPIALDEFASYKNNYLWHTDIVDSVKIKSIKIQYMDKSIINIANPESIILPKKYVQYILGK